jgi:hypothetical protein
LLLNTATFLFLLKWKEEKHLRINPRRSSQTIQNIFIALWKTKSQLENVRVRDANCKQYRVMRFFLMIEGYIPQATDKIKAKSSGGYSLRGFREGELPHTILSWEALESPRENYRAP